MGEAQMTKKPRKATKARKAVKKLTRKNPATRKTATKKPKKTAPRIRKSKLSLQGEIMLLRLDNIILELRARALRNLLEKVASSFIGSVPLSEDSYIRSVYISGPLIEEIYDALDGFKSLKTGDGDV
jgi:hypothetical protein